MKLIQDGVVNDMVIWCDSGVIYDSKLWPTIVDVNCRTDIKQNRIAASIEGVEYQCDSVAGKFDGNGRCYCNGNDKTVAACWGGAYGDVNHEDLGRLMAFELWRKDGG